jgi:hypothetical protein
MALDDDRNRLVVVLQWIRDVLSRFVREAPSDLYDSRLGTQMRDALPEVEERIEAAITRVREMSEGSDEWKRLRDRGLTGLQLEWKLTLLQTVFQQKPLFIARVARVLRDSLFRVWRPHILESIFAWLDTNLKVLRDALAWINSFLESFGLDFVKEFKDGVERFIEYQRRPTSIPPIFPPEGL